MVEGRPTTSGPTIEVEIKTVGKMKKEGRAGEFIVLCDEGPNIGGEGSAPRPLDYFMLSVGF